MRFVDASARTERPGAARRVAPARARPQTGGGGAEIDSRPQERTPRLTHLPALDGLRGLAVLAVVLYHFAPGVAPGGFLGVDLFFVLSGFLITSLLVNEWDAKRHLSFVSFWGRRARRLLPALFLVLAAVGVYAFFLANRVDAHDVASDGLSALTYVANWHFIATKQGYIQQFVQQAPTPLRHMWSLAIEEQFYLVWPLVVGVVGWLAAGRSRRAGRDRRRFRRVLLGLCMTLGCASFLWMIALYRSAGDVNRVYYGTDTRAFIILVGAALGVLSAGAPTATARLRGPLIAIGSIGAIALVLAISVLTIGSSWLYRGGYGVIALGMVVVLAAAAQPGTNPLARVLTLRPLVSLGLISYGVYLWHWPIGLWLTAQDTGLAGPGLFALRVALTLLAALLSYEFVEKPTRRGRFPHWKISNPGVVPLVGVTVVAVVLLIPALAFPSVAAVPSVAAPTVAPEVTSRYATAPHCDAAPRSPAPGLRPPTRVELVGNSIAKEISPCLTSILSARGVELRTLLVKDYFQPCKSIQAIRDAVSNAATRPSAVIYFALDIESCAPRLITVWKAAGVHIYLAPPVPAVGGGVMRGRFRTVSLALAAYYQTLARQDPMNLTVLDAGPFLRDDTGKYVWRMPCLPGEPGCDRRHTVGVRFVDGFHFCTDPAFPAQLKCPQAGSRGGQRRVAAAVAVGLLSNLQMASAPAP